MGPHIDLKDGKRELMEVRTMEPTRIPQVLIRGVRGSKHLPLGRGSRLHQALCLIQREQMYALQNFTIILSSSFLTFSYRQTCELSFLCRVYFVGRRRISYPSARDGINSSLCGALDEDEEEEVISLPVMDARE